MIKPIAIHLPQFHPFPENDKWWGKGFTEWTNVTKAKPLFKDHYQPQLPADLGFYDLRLEEARLAQIELAKKYGIFGFCYYHYWFNGKRLMNEPLDRMLNNPKEDFPFMLCWANENWTRTWDGAEKDILIEQKYNDKDDLNHIAFLCEHFFKDSRYIKINGKPFISVYRPSLFPNFNNTLNLWREVAKEHGFPDLYVGIMNSFGDLTPAEQLGADANIQFAPHLNGGQRLYGSRINSIYSKSVFYKKRFFEKINNQFLININEIISKKIQLNKGHKFNKNRFFDYRNLVKINSLLPLPKKTYPSVFPSWDNSSRKSCNAYVYLNSSPELYGEWLSASIKKFIPFSPEENFIFINAWNEWAEGNHLEPCKKWGSQYLEKTKSILDSLRN